MPIKKSTFVVAPTSRVEEDSFFRAQEEFSTNIGLRPSLNKVELEESVQAVLNNEIISPLPNKLTIKRSPSVDSEDTFMPASWQSGNSTLRARQMNGDINLENDPR